MEGFRLPNVKTLHPAIHARQSSARITQGTKKKLEIKAERQEQREPQKICTRDWCYPHARRRDLCMRA